MNIYNHQQKRYKQIKVVSVRQYLRNRIKIYFCEDEVEDGYGD